MMGGECEVMERGNVCVVMGEEKCDVMEREGVVKGR